MRPRKIRVRLRVDAHANLSISLAHISKRTFPDVAALFIVGDLFSKTVIPASSFQGPVDQSIVSLTSSLVVKMLTVLVSTMSNSQEFLLKKCE